MPRQPCESVGQDAIEHRFTSNLSTDRFLQLARAVEDPHSRDPDGNQPLRPERLASSRRAEWAADASRNTGPTERERGDAPQLIQPSLRQCTARW